MRRALFSANSSESRSDTLPAPSDFFPLGMMHDQSSPGRKIQRRRSHAKLWAGVIG